MSAADRWVRDDDEPDATPRAPVDVDRAQQVAVAWLSLVAVVAATIGGAYLLAMAFAGWVGALLVLAVGLLGSGYSLVKAEQRRAVTRDRTQYAKGHERPVFDPVDE